jgi:saccharopine dehydrogenase-like NADP-dependent oxidoreductase
MTQLSDRISGIGIAIRAQVTGYQAGKPVTVISTLVHENTAAAAGAGTGSIAQSILAGQLSKPGIWSVEQALTTELFEQAMQRRNIQIYSQTTPLT